ncbi:hypothetical protein POTOM_025833 [Populus tomentosa]|uniref:Uncharacterized protein n=1 Tax=Populus tomentosa TaxID=118781 RepID=A0A8X7ZIQ5_POPTO|nr:hypothetical protein POTOM_025833 [Populus tomentosa]
MNVVEQDSKSDIGDMLSVSSRNIKIKMFDDAIRTLYDVRHIPNLRKTQISLGTLDCVGFNFKSEGGVLKVSENAITVMKGPYSLV